MKAAQQHGLPVVPCIRADPANITDRQHRQQIKPLAGLHDLGEIPHRPRIRDIALLRHVGHRQVIADQPFDGFAFLCRQTKARGNLARDLRAKDRMILGPPLTDVV